MSACHRQDGQDINYGNEIVGVGPVADPQGAPCWCLPGQQVLVPVHPHEHSPGRPSSLGVKLFAFRLWRASRGSTLCGVSSGVSISSGCGDVRIQVQPVTVGGVAVEDSSCCGSGPSVRSDAPLSASRHPTRKRARN